jgi:hypothetical protein
MATQWTPEHMRSVFESVKNWGRWGEDDEAGAQGLIQTAGPTNPPGAHSRPPPPPAEPNAPRARSCVGL